MTTRKIVRWIALGLGDVPPTEFRVFERGIVDSTKGSVLVDDESIARIMSAYQKHGADIMIDLEHQALDPFPSPDPTSRDARGWGRLEVRVDGVWCVDVKWTPDGVARLTEKRQRYISPAFYVEDVPEGGPPRVVQIINIALTALPATHGLDALIAASQSRKVRTSMTPEQMQQIAVALGLGDGATVEEVIGAIAELNSKLESALCAGDAAEADAASSADANPPPGEMMAATERDRDAIREILALSSRGSIAEALADVRAWHATHARTEARAAELDRIERESLGVRLVKAGMRPATVWADPFAKVGERALRPILAGLTLEELRAEVKLHEDGPARPSTPRAKAEPEGLDVTLPGGVIVRMSAREVELCAAQQIDPATYAANKQRLSPR